MSFMITARELVKNYGGKRVVDEVDFTVRPGLVTGFLGPNGAGKSTTMRMIAGLARPTSGAALVGGRRFSAQPAPLQKMGVLLDAKAVHGGRTAFDHLSALAATHRIGARRVREVLELTGLESVANRRVGKFSLGMSQRLGISAAMLGDPAVLMLDEPVNGLDPEGVLWVRQFLRSLAAEGRTVFLSSHLMSEMALTADHLIVLGQGKVLADAPVAEIVAGGTGPRVRVRSSQAAELACLVARLEVTVHSSQPGVVEITGIDAVEVGDLAARHGIPIHELTMATASLEEAYMALTGDTVEYRTEAVR